MEAVEEEDQQKQEEEEEQKQRRKLVCSYLGISFCVFFALLSNSALCLLPSLQTQIRTLSARLFQAQEQLKQMKSRRKEDSKANARVAEIFASHRSAWQAEEKRLLRQVEAANEGVTLLRARAEELERGREEWKGRVEVLEREVGDREEMMIGLMSDDSVFVEDEEAEEESGVCKSRKCCGGVDEQNLGFVYEQQQQRQQQEDLFGSASSKFWAQRATLWHQDVQYESLESLYQMKHFVARRESPWKVDGESTGVSSKLKILEQELLNLERVDKTDLSKVPSLMRKQAKRCQALASKIDDLCSRMQASDPREPTLSTEFQTQRQTEFLLEAFRLQQRASETGQKLTALQTEIGKSYHGDELVSQSKLAVRRSFDSIRNNLKEVQRSLEIRLARIIGELEGILSRDGSSRTREYYVSGYPFVQ